MAVSTDAPFVFDWEAAFNDTNKEKKPIVLSESREIVLVPGGRSEKIRSKCGCLLLFLSVMI